MRSLACALLGAWLCVAPAMAGTPAPIAPGERPVPNSTESELWYAMDQAERELRSSPLLVRDPSLNQYVRDVACKVAQDFCPDLRVYIVDVPVFNASMAPNGTLIVFTGALLRMQDEAELAVVLGHEFAHFRQRHSLRGWNKAKSTSAFLSTFTVLSGFSVVAIVAQLGGMANVSRFSRDMEREADRIGFTQSTGLGYDPQAGAEVWGRMLREENASKRPKPWPVFASHPNTAERLEDTTAAARAHSGTQKEVGREAYQAAVRPHLDRWLDEELSRRTYDTSIAVIGELKSLADPRDAGLYAFYLAEAYRQRGKGDDRDVAARHYAEAIALPSAPAAAWREHAYILRNRGERSTAVDAFRRYLSLAPDASDRSFIESSLSQIETTLSQTETTP